MLTRPVLVTPIVVLVAGWAFAQKVPQGVAFRRATAERNASARTLLEAALTKRGSYAATRLPASVTCGPILWSDLRRGASPLLGSAKRVDVLLSVPESIHVEMRAFITTNEREEFWRALWTAFPDLKAGTVREPSSSDISHFWATIPFDIQEPLFVVDTGAHQFIVDLPDEGSGATPDLD